MQTVGSDRQILIAYFTWADNTQVENPEAVDVDATTSASVLPPGNAAKIAGWIQERTGGELFSIIVAEPYSSDYDECLDRAADEKAEDTRPELVSAIQDITADLPDSEILEPIGVYRPDVDSSKPDVDAWLEILGF